ncbi:MAG: A/G-specific adenine glycosylase [Calditrichaeota bacterium]|nr:A/G-specific adenine glycosylase [Calditrichota bacterium]
MSLKLSRSVDQTSEGGAATGFPFALEGISQEADWFARQLTDWYNPTRRDLPWRETTDPYAVLVAEIMLQQTVWSVVVEYYRRWVARFPTLESLHQADESELLRYWEGLGYYRRARSLKVLAAVVMDQCGGKIPDDVEELKQLPGVGDYTAAAVMALAFDRPEPAIDANIRRILERYLGLSNWSNPSAADAGGFLTKALSKTSPRLLTLALMELGQTVCLPRSPRCAQCPLQKECKAAVSKQFDDAQMRIRRPVHRRDSRVLLIVRGSLILLHSPGDDRFPGLWLLPLVEGDSGLDPNSIGLERMASSRLKPVSHHYTVNVVRLLPEVWQADMTFEPPMGMVWNSFSEMERLLMPSAHRSIVRQLLSVQSDVLR